MKMNKTESTGNILAIAKRFRAIRPCRKMSLYNIVFPEWSELGLPATFIPQRIKTKELPSGCDYSELEYRVVIRVLGGRLLDKDGRPDVYAWGDDMVKKYLNDPDSLPRIGVRSAKGLLNLMDILATIKTEEERLIFADMFTKWTIDLFLVKTDAEDRFCVEVTQELYDAGITACVDSWMKPEKPEDGDMMDATILNVGDFLIVDGNKVYCIRRDEFFTTHELV